jgi:hypothetical protein
MRRATLGILLVVTACGSETTPPPPAVASITISSPIGTRLATGRTVQLVAEARDAAGNVIDSVDVTWASTDAGIAQVTQSGVVSGFDPGGVTITATVSGVSGAFGVAVIAADLDAVAPTLIDPFLNVLVANLTSPVRGRVQAALTQCGTGAVSGNFTTLEACVASGRAEVTAATDPTDRLLIHLVALYFERIHRLMNL